MGFGLLFVGYPAFLFFKILPPAMAVGAYLMYRASGAFSPEAFKSVGAGQFAVISGFSGKYARYSGKLLLSESIIRVSETVLGWGADYVEKLLVFIAGVYKDASLVIKNGFRSLAVDSVPIMLYFKFYLEWVVDEFQLVVVSIHKDTQKHKSMFGFEDDELFW